MCDLVIQCPECGYENVNAIISDDERVIHFCENCGWEKIARYPFRVGVWNVKIRQALAPIDVLQSLLTDKDIVSFLRPRLKGVSHLSTPIPNFDLGDDYFRGEIAIANNVYLSQMIVLAVTYAELMIRDFYRCLFFEQPKRMNSFLASDGKGKATVDLNELIHAQSKDDLIERLVERSAAKASGRKIDEVVLTMITDCKLKLPHPIAEDLRLLNEQRNRIVHEGETDQIEAKQVLSAYGQLMYLLYILSEAVIRYKLPFVDEVDFLYDFRKQLKCDQVSD